MGGLVDAAEAKVAAATSRAGAGGMLLEQLDAAEQSARSAQRAAEAMGSGGEQLEQRAGEAVSRAHVAAEGLRREAAERQRQELQRIEDIVAGAEATVEEAKAREEQGDVPRLQEAARAAKVAEAAAQALQERAPLPEAQALVARAKQVKNEARNEIASLEADERRRKDAADRKLLEELVAGAEQQVLAAVQAADAAVQTESDLDTAAAALSQAAKSARTAALEAADAPEELAQRADQAAADADAKRTELNDLAEKRERKREMEQREAQVREEEERKTTLRNEEGRPQLGQWVTVNDGSFGKSMFKVRRDDFDSQPYLLIGSSRWYYPKELAIAPKPQKLEKASAPRCAPPGNHPMLWTKFARGMYSMGWSCDVCGKNGGTDEHRWCCPLCVSDYCKNCMPKDFNEKTDSPDKKYSKGFIADQRPKLTKAIKAVSNTIEAEFRIRHRCRSHRRFIVLSERLAGGCFDIAVFENESLVQQGQPQTKGRVKSAENQAGNKFVITLDDDRKLQLEAIADDCKVKWMDKLKTLWIDKLKTLVDQPIGSDSLEGKLVEADVISEIRNPLKKAAGHDHLKVPAGASSPNPLRKAGDDHQRRQQELEKQQREFRKQHAMRKRDPYREHHLVQYYNHVDDAQAAASGDERSKCECCDEEFESETQSYDAIARPDEYNRPTGPTGPEDKFTWVSEREAARPYALCHACFENDAYAAFLTAVGKAMPRCPNGDRQIKLLIADGANPKTAKLPRSKLGMLRCAGCNGKTKKSRKGQNFDFKECTYGCTACEFVLCKACFTRDIPRKAAIKAKKRELDDRPTKDDTVKVQKPADTTDKTRKIYWEGGGAVGKIVRDDRDSQPYQIEFEIWDKEAKQVRTEVAPGYWCEREVKKIDLGRQEETDAEIYSKQLEQPDKKRQFQPGCLLGIGSKDLHGGADAKGHGFKVCEEPNNAKPVDSLYKVTVDFVNYALPSDEAKPSIPLHIALLKRALEEGGVVHWKCSDGKMRDVRVDNLEKGKNKKTGKEEVKNITVSWPVDPKKPKGERTPETCGKGDLRRKLPQAIIAPQACLKAGFAYSRDMYESGVLPYFEVEFESVEFEPVFGSKKHDAPPRVGIGLARADATMVEELRDNGFWTPAEEKLVKERKAAAEKQAQDEKKKNVSGGATQAQRQKRANKWRTTRIRTEATRACARSYVQPRELVNCHKAQLLRREAVAEEGGAGAGDGDGDGDGTNKGGNEAPGTKSQVKELKAAIGDTSEEGEKGKHRMVGCDIDNSFGYYSDGTCHVNAGAKKDASAPFFRHGRMKEELNFKHLQGAQLHRVRTELSKLRVADDGIKTGADLLNFDWPMQTAKASFLGGGPKDSELFEDESLLVGKDERKRNQKEFLENAKRDEHIVTVEAAYIEGEEVVLRKCKLVGGLDDDSVDVAYLPDGKEPFVENIKAANWGERFALRAQVDPKKQTQTHENTVGCGFDIARREVFFTRRVDCWCRGTKPNCALCGGSQEVAEHVGSANYKACRPSGQGDAAEFQPVISFERVRRARIVIHWKCLHRKQGIMRLRKFFNGASYHPSNRAMVRLQEVPFLPEHRDIMHFVADKHDCVEADAGETDLHEVVKQYIGSQVILRCNSFELGDKVSFQQRSDKMIELGSAADGSELKKGRGKLCRVPPPAGESSFTTDLLCDSFVVHVVRAHHARLGVRDFFSTAEAARFQAEQSAAGDDGWTSKDEFVFLRQSEIQHRAGGVRKHISQRFIRLLTQIVRFSHNPISCALATSFACNEVATDTSLTKHQQGQLSTQGAKYAKMAYDLVDNGAS